MVGILLSYWGGLFSGATLVSGRGCENVLPSLAESVYQYRCVQGGCENVLTSLAESAYQQVTLPETNVAPGDLKKY